MSKQQTSTDSNSTNVTAANLKLKDNIQTHQSVSRAMAPTDNLKLMTSNSSDKMSPTKGQGTSRVGQFYQ